MSSAWCQLGAASVNRGVLTVRCKGGAVDENGAAPDFGDAPMVCALGVTAMPYPPTAEGAVEALLHKTIQGISGVVYGARDTRSAKIVGALKPGDTVLHSTGPQEAAQVQLKEEKRIAALLTKTGGGKTMMLALDGDAEEVKLTHAGAIIEINKSGDIAIVNSSGVGVLLQGKNVQALGAFAASGSVITGDQNAATFAARGDQVILYLTALETLLSGIAGATLPPTTAAVTAFQSATAALKAGIAAQFTKVS